MEIRPYYLAIIAAMISSTTSYLSISSDAKSMINLFMALLIIISIILSYREYKKSKRESRN